jgi:hypothetical protein
MLNKSQSRPAAPPPSAAPFSSGPFADPGFEDWAGDASGSPTFDDNAYGDTFPPSSNTNNSAPAFGDDTYGSVFAPRSSSSVDWGGSSGAPAHGSGKSVPQPSDEEYDDWLAHLPIGSTPADSGTMGDDFSGPFSVSPAGADAYDTGYDALSDESMTNTGAAFDTPDPYADQYANPYSFIGDDNQSAPEPSYLENTYGYEATPRDADEPPQKPSKARAAVSDDDLAAQLAAPDFAADLPASKGNVFGGSAKTGKGGVFPGESAPPVLGSSIAASPSAQLFRAIPADIQSGGGGGGGRAPAADRSLLIGVAVLTIGNLISIVLLLINLTGG